MKPIDAIVEKPPKVKIKHKTFKTISGRLFLEELVSTGVFVGLFALMRVLFRDINIINGYGIQMQFVILSLGLFILRTYTFRALYLLIAPFIILALGAENWPLNYLLPSLSFFPFIFLSPIVDRCWYEKEKNWKNTTIIIAVILIMCFVSYTLTAFWYVLSGVLQYEVSWGFSITFNAPIAYISFAIQFGIMIASIYPIWLLKGKFNPNHYYSVDYYDAQDE